MRLAVTGASGFIGRNFVERFQGNFDQIKSLSRVAPWKDGQIQEINGDLGNPNSLKELTQGVDVVLHAAFDSTYRQNIPGIRSLLDCCVRNDVKKLIHLSSYVVYDFSQSPITEASRFATRHDLYTREKIQIEKILRSPHATNLSIVIVQPTVVFGPGSTWSSAMFEAAKHREICMPNSGLNHCNSIYIDDLTELLHQLVIGSAKPGVETRIASNLLSSWREFLQLHADLLKKKSKPVNQFNFTATSRRLYSDSVPMNWLMSSSGIFPFSVLVKRRLKDKTAPSMRTSMDAPLSDTPFRFSGTARLCQSWSHEVVSKHGLERKRLFDWFDRFNSQL